MSWYWITLIGLGCFALGVFIGVRARILLEEMRQELEDAYNHNF